VVGYVARALWTTSTALGRQRLDHPPALRTIPAGKNKIIITTTKRPRYRDETDAYRALDNETRQYQEDADQPEDDGRHLEAVLVLVRKGEYATARALLLVLHDHIGCDYDDVEPVIVVLFDALEANSPTSRVCAAPGTNASPAVCIAAKSALDVRGSVPSQLEDCLASSLSAKGSTSSPPARRRRHPPSAGTAAMG
jgi:hypothetical protein